MELAVCLEREQQHGFLELKCSQGSVHYLETLNFAKSTRFPTLTVVFQSLLKPPFPQSPLGLCWREEEEDSSWNVSICLLPQSLAASWISVIIRMEVGFSEKEMATHSSVLAWRILWTEEPGGLPSMGSHRVSRTRLKRFSSSSSSRLVSSPPWKKENASCHGYLNSNFKLCVCLLLPVLLIYYKHYLFICLSRTVGNWKEG